MRALVLQAVNQPLILEDRPIPTPKKGEALVRVRAAALNHRDVWIGKGQYAGIKTPIIPGSDAAGEYEGRAVIVDPSLQWGANPRVQGKDYHIMGMPTDGAFAEYVVVSKKNLHTKPTHLDWAQAAALPLAGLTAWRCMFSRCGAKKGEKVLITGIGGGVALFALQFAVAAGCSVWVSSGSDEKIQKAVALGAKNGENYRVADWDKRLRADSGGGFDVVIDSAAGEGFSKLVNLCLPGGRIGIYGGTMGKITDLSPQQIFWKQIGIYGSTMGHAREFRQMTDFVERREIVPVVDHVFDLSEAAAAYEKMDRGEQFGKIVFRCSL